MANKDLSRFPKTIIKDEIWFYEEPQGLIVIHEIKHEGKYIRTDQFPITWQKIRASLARKDKNDGE